MNRIRLAHTAVGALLTSHLIWSTGCWVFHFAGSLRLSYRLFIGVKRQVLPVWDVG
jgi:hypothetical protein